MSTDCSMLPLSAQADLQVANRIFQCLLPISDAVPSSVAKLQAEKLAILINFICRHVPYFHHLSPRPLLSLADLPVTNKATLMDSLPDTCAEPDITIELLRSHVNHCTSPHDLFRNFYHIRRTSGTTGYIGFFLWDLVLARIAEESATRFVPSPRQMHKPVVAVSPVTYWDPLLALLEDLHAIPLEAGVEGTIKQLHRLKPKSIIGSTGFVVALAQEQIDGRLDIAPECIIIGAEQCTPWQWNQIRCAWGIDPMMQYGMSEAGLIASRCTKGNWHIHEDTVILECLDSEWQPAMPGQPCVHALITRLFGPIQPIIRYELSDLLIAGPEECQCGAPFRTLSSIEGRKRAILWLEDQQAGCRPISAYHLIPELEATPSIMRYQLRYETPNVLEIAILTRQEIDDDSLVARLRRKIQAAGAKPPAIVLRKGDVPSVWAAPPGSKEHHVYLSVTRESMLQFLKLRS